MSEQQNLEVVRRGYEAFGRGDIETLLSLLDENIEWRTPGPADLPTAGVRRGRQEVGAFFGLLNQVFEIQRFEPQTFLTGGDRVVVLGTDTAVLRATDKVLVDEPWAHVFTVKDGKIVAFQEYLDTGAFVTEFRAAQVKT